MVRYGVTQYTELDGLFILLTEGGYWHSCTDEPDLIKYVATLRHGPRAIRRGCIVYDFVLKGHRICPWRYWDNNRNNN